ncbi:MAG: hypothetical protein WCF80_11435 [Pseudolabrys sp.]|jgi:hypothetical protein|nr:hypothetical protein [Pseudolabrys sp.]
MNVVKFPPVALQATDGWQSAELQQFLAVSSGAIAAGEASGWHVGVTERGDPQVFLVGPPPDYDCILSISRLGRLYVIEDGAGRVLFEHDNPMLLSEQAAAALRRRKTAIIARVAVVWCALREAFEEKTEEIMAEPIELLTHIAPQLAALV